MTESLQNLLNLLVERHLDTYTIHTAGGGGAFRKPRHSEHTRKHRVASPVKSY